MDTGYIASCKGRNSNGTYEINHLIRVQRGSNLKWKHPVRLGKVSWEQDPLQNVLLMVSEMNC